MKKILFTSAGIIAVSIGGFALANSVSIEKEHRTAPEFIKAVDANDFTAFQLSAKDTPMKIIDTQEEFNQLVLAHTAAKKGDMTVMNMLRTNLGLPEMKKGKKGGKGFKDNKKDNSNHKEVKTAIESGDFTAFQSAVKDSPLAVVDTQEKFAKLVEAEKTIKSAHENMQKVRNDLGIKTPSHFEEK